MGALTTSLPLAGLSASASGASPDLGPSLAAPSSSAPLAPCVGDPLPEDALFLVALGLSDLGSLDCKQVLCCEVSLKCPIPRLASAFAIAFTLCCGAGASEVRVFTSFGQFKLYTGPLEHSRTVCHGFAAEGECRVYVRAAGRLFPERNQWN